jgi:hypothetical protein
LAGPASLYAHIVAAVADLGEITGRRVRFGVWHERGVSYLERGVRAPRRKSAEDNVLPMHATAMGKALLAFAQDVDVRRVVTRHLPAYTTRTLTTPARLHEELAAVRSCGVAVARQELHADQWGIAAPVFGPSGVIAALEVVGRGFWPDFDCLRPVVVCGARALGRRLSDQPALLPSGVGPAPLRWPVDPTSLDWHDKSFRAPTWQVRVGRRGQGSAAPSKPDAAATAAESGWQRHKQSQGGSTWQT